MSLWSNETFDAYAKPSGQAPAYLSAGERRRWEMLRHAKMLYQGKHRQYFLEEGRSQFNFPEEDIAGVLTRRYLTLNLLKLVSHTIADLMFGAKAKLDAPTVEQTDRLDELARRSLIHSRFHEVAVQASWAGGGFLESLRYGGEAYVDVIAADEVHPQGALMPDGQYLRYVRYATDTIGDEKNRTTLLLKTTYLPGFIRRELRKLDGKGNITGEALALDQWPAFEGLSVKPEESTGINQCTITYIPNKTGDGTGSDYDGLIEMQDSVNAKFAQVARVLAKHADPKIAIPSRSASPDGTVPATHDTWFYEIKEEIPQYITWSAELDAAMKDRTEAILAFCAAAEMSPVLLGIRQGATPDAARKLRLEATKDLAKVARKALMMEPAIARAVDIAQRLEATSYRNRPAIYTVDPIGVAMRDGLPNDPKDDAEVVSLLRGAGVMSVEDGVEVRYQDPDGKAAEVARIAAEKSAAMPTFFGPLGGETPAERTQSTSEPAAPEPAEAA